MLSLGCPRAVYFGDDETDEDVFRLRDARVLGIRIGMNPHSASACYLRGQEETGAAIDRIMEFLD